MSDARTVTRLALATAVSTALATGASAQVENLDTATNFATIQAAIDDVTTLAGHTLEIAAGTLVEGTVTIDKSLTIQGVGIGSTILEPSAAVGLLVTTDDVTLQDMTIRNGDQAIRFNLPAGTIDNAQVLRVSMEDNLTRGVEVHNDTTMTNFLFDECNFERCVIGLRVSSSGHLDGGSFTACTFTSNNLGLYHANDGGTSTFDNVLVTGCTFTDHTLAYGTQGTAVFFEEGNNVTIDDNDFVDNRRDVQIFHWYGAATPVTNIAITNNTMTGTTSDVLAIFNAEHSSGQTVFDNILIQGNTATTAVGAFAIFAGAHDSYPSPGGLGWSTVEVSCNTFVDSNGDPTAGIRFFPAGLPAGESLAGQVLDVSKNWWGTTDLSTAEALSADPDNTNFDPILIAPPTPACVTPIENLDTAIRYLTLQEAIDDPLTLDGHTIEIQVSSHSEGQVTVNKGVTIQGFAAGAELLPTAAVGLLIDTDDVTVQDLTIRNGDQAIRYHLPAGTIDNAQVLRVSMEDNSSRGVEVHNDTTMTNFLFDECNFERCVTGLRVSSSGHFDGGSFTGCTFTSNNIGLYHANDGGTSTFDNVLVTGCTFTDHSPTWGTQGTAIFFEEGNNVTIDDNDFVDNRRDVQIFQWYGAATPVTNIAITNNTMTGTTSDVLAIFNNEHTSGQTIFDGVIVQGNTATTAPGAHAVFAGAHQSYPSLGGLGWSTVQINCNTFIDSNGDPTAGVRFFPAGLPDGESLAGQLLDVRSNWWGTADLATVQTLTTDPGSTSFAPILPGVPGPECPCLEISDVEGCTVLTAKLGESNLADNANILVVHYNAGTTMATAGPANIAFIEIRDAQFEFSPTLPDPENYALNVVLPSPTSDGSNLPPALTALDLDVFPDGQPSHHGDSAIWTIDYYDGVNAPGMLNGSRAHTVLYGSICDLNQTFNPLNDGTNPPGTFDDQQFTNTLFRFADGLYHSINNPEIDVTTATIAASGTPIPGLAPAQPFLLGFADLTEVGFSSDAALLTGSADPGFVNVWQATVGVPGTVSSVTNPNTVIVDVELQGVSEPRLVRCITFELVDCDGIEPDLEIELPVTFLNGVTCGGVPLPASCAYDCVRVRDRLHTLARTAAIVADGDCCRADVTGSNALIGGNANDDDFVDILDFGTLVGQFMTPGPGDTDCTTAGPDTDFSGDGNRDIADFTFVQLNFLLASEDDCCTTIASASEPGPRRASGLNGRGPLERVRVTQLDRHGLGHLANADLNGDGWIDSRDIVEFLMRQ